MNLSKKVKKKKMTKLFDKTADIITTDSDFHIRKARVYICPTNKHKGYYGKILTISSPIFNNDNVHEIREIYEPDKTNNRLRLRLRRYQNAKKFKTIEKSEDNSVEKKIAVIEYKDFDEYIYSVGDIKKFVSDIHPDKINSNAKMLKLVLENEYFNKGDNKKVA